MNYAELKKAYEESLQKCSELEKEIDDKDLRIEHLTELLIKRNKMLFGQKCIYRSDCPLCTDFLPTLAASAHGAAHKLNNILAI